MPSSFHREYRELLLKNHSSLRQLPELDISTLVSEFNVSLKSSLDRSIRKGISSLYRASRSAQYQKCALASQPKSLTAHIPNDSVLMAYDFHVDPENEKVALIEVNTNASGYLFVNTIYQLKSQTDHLSSLAESFQNEWRLIQKSQAPEVFIIDEQVTDQNMYPEFLMYQDFFTSLGWNSKILDVEKQQDRALILDAVKKRDILIYNRYCDFTLSESRSLWLRQIYENQQAHLSPNPKEYIFLADKSRLTEWSTPDHEILSHLSQEEKESIQEILIPTRLANSYQSPEELWSQRKKLFFKPRQSYGGKSTYRGKNITKKVFERISTGDTIVQEFFPAPKFGATSPNEPDQEWKYDLRYYVYQGEVQLVCARIYQGQVTNFKTLGGGFATVTID